MASVLGVCPWYIGIQTHYSSKSKVEVMGKNRLRKRDYKPFDVDFARSPPSPPPHPWSEFQLAHHMGVALWRGPDPDTVAAAVPPDLRERFTDTEATFLEQQFVRYKKAWDMIAPKRLLKSIPLPSVFVSLATHYAVFACSKRSQRIAIDTITSYVNTFVDLSAKPTSHFTDDQRKIFDYIVGVLIRVINGIKTDTKMARDLLTLSGQPISTYGAAVGFADMLKKIHFAYDKHKEPQDICQCCGQERPAHHTCCQICGLVWPVPVTVALADL